MLLDLVFPLIIAELGLRAISTLLSFMAQRLHPASPSSQAYLRSLSHALIPLSAILPASTSTYGGCACTVLLCTLPCFAAPVIMASLTAALLPNFGLPENLLVPSLMTPRRAAVLGIPVVVLSLWVGASLETWSPSGIPVATTLHSLALLLTLRVVWSVVRICLLMPALLISHAIPEGIQRTPQERMIRDLLPDQSVEVPVSAERYTVSRLRLERGVDAIAVVHPHRPDKWVVTLHGNGECLELGFSEKLGLAAELGCSVIACDYRDVGLSPGLLLAGSDMVSDAAVCVRYCEQRLNGSDPASSILILGQSMGGGVAAELAATRFPHLACVNERSFSSLAAVSASTVGLGRCVGVVRLVLALAFSHLPWRPPLETARHWHTLPTGRKLLIYHPNDRVIGSAAALHTALEQQGALEGTHVIRLGGKPRDAHNEHPASFSPTQWREAVDWMKGVLELPVQPPHRFR